MVVALSSLVLVPIGGYKYIDVSSSGLTLADSDFFVSNWCQRANDTVKILTSPTGEPAVEAFFEGTHPNI